MTLLTQMQLVLLYEEMDSMYQVKCEMTVIYSMAMAALTNVKSNLLSLVLVAHLPQQILV